jgi:hypothetical protein
MIPKNFSRMAWQSPSISTKQGAQRAKKKVNAGNIAHYTVLALRSDRRSTGIRKNDVLAPACQLNGHARVQSMDEPLRNDEDGDEPLTLHDCLAADVDDPATAAARRLDWASVLDSLDRTAKAILVALIEGRELTLLVHRLKRSRTTLHYDKVKLGRLIQVCLGQDILVQAQARPGWRNTLDVIQERLTCRSERRAA